MNSQYPELYARNNGAQREWASRTWGVFSEEVFKKTALNIESVMDFGCGTGDITTQLSKWVSESSESSASPKMIVGMDVSAEMIEYCDKHYEQKDELGTEFAFSVADAGDPSSMNASWRSNFDLLISFTAMHWVPDQRKVLQSVEFCLKPGGLALLLLPMKAPPAFLSGKRTISTSKSALVVIH